MKMLRELLQYIISFAGAFIFSLLIIFSIALMTIDGVAEIKWVVWFFGIILLFYIFVASLLWELLFWLIHFKTWWRGGIVYLLMGMVWGGIATTILTFTIGDTDVIGWIGGISIMGIAALVFYAIRRVSVIKNGANTT